MKTHNTQHSMRMSDSTAERMKAVLSHELQKNNLTKSSYCFYSTVELPILKAVILTQLTERG